MGGMMSGGGGQMPVMGSGDSKSIGAGMSPNVMADGDSGGSPWMKLMKVGMGAAQGALSNQNRQQPQGGGSAQFQTPQQPQLNAAAYGGQPITQTQPQMNPQQMMNPWFYGSR